MTKLQLLSRISLILKQHCEDPSDAIIREGDALVAIGNALKGMSIAEARATMKAVAHLSDVQHPNEIEP